MAVIKTATMKAVRIHAYGGPEVLVGEEAPRPEPAEDEALIRVDAVGVNPIDWKVREGHAKSWLEHKFPLIIGWDVAGVVENTGNRVSNLRIGDEVYGMLDTSRDGAYAEYAVSRASDLAPRPRSLDPVRSAAIPIAAVTAWQALFDIARLSPGQSVLIHAAAGGVGHFAVQLARWKKARVICTASERNVSFLKGLGADEVIDYQKVKFDEVLKDIDVVLDLMGGETQERSWEVLRKNGILVSAVGLSSPEKGAKMGIRSEAFIAHRDSGQLSRIAALIDSGDIKPVIAAIMPLEEAAKAHEILQSGHVRGKIVLKVLE